MRRRRLLGGALAASAWAYACSLPPDRAFAEATSGRLAPVMLGGDRFLAEDWRELAGRGVGLVTNQTGHTSAGVPLVDAIRHNPAIALRALYAPEHGLRGDQPAGHYVPSYLDPATQLPVYSLYGPTRKPTAAMLAGIDVLLFDIQDVGDRTYTFISTLAEVMAAAQAFGKSVWVLDRPNPLGGAIVEGPVLEPRFASFIGLYPLPIRHGLTIGEVAQLYRTHFGIDCDLRVLAMDGYSRAMFWPETGLWWVPTSPKIPTWETAFVYPATGLLAQAGINNATETATPFFEAGAYQLDGAQLARYLQARDVPGIDFAPALWTPEAGFWQGKTLSGVRLAVVDRAAYRAVRTAVEILCAVRAIAPDHLVIRNPLGLARDWGTDSLRRGLLAGQSPDEILAAWEPHTRTFVAERGDVLLYD
ncbi:MAG: exo-beta-N-acetylmuramidase NamZ family protein [Vulcanimicrobiaceae bacterium]